MDVNEIPALMPPGWTSLELRSRRALTRWVCEISRLGEEGNEEFVTGRGATPQDAVTVAISLAALKP